MSRFLSGIKLSRSDMRGAVTLSVLIIIVTLIFVFNKIENSKAVTEEIEKSIEVPHTSIKLQNFDPNTVELRQLLELGFSKSEALSLLRYRASGKIFRIKEEVIGCYGISDSLYFSIEPYIIIGEEYRYKPRVEQQERIHKPTQSIEVAATKPHLMPSPFLIDTVGVKYLTAIGALTPRQAEVFVKWRDMSGIETLEDLKACYTVSDSIAEWMAEYAIFTPKFANEAEDVKAKAKPQKQLTELNAADSTELVAIYGIGAKTAAAIMDYRKKLGGFYSKEQLSEIKIITESNFEKIIAQIYVDNSDISKIDINFATAKQMGSHPYFTSLKIRRLLKIRELKGGWRTIEEMIEDNIFTLEEAQRVQPYLHFEVLDPL